MTQAKHKTGIYRGGLDDAPISAKARVVVVHDCSQPIARAIALRLADRGQCVLACGDEALKLQDLPRETALGGLIEVSSAPRGKRTERALTLFGRIDAIISVAECPQDLVWGPFEAEDPAAALEFGILRPSQFTSELADALTKARRGRIIMVNTLPGLPFGAATAAARGGFEALADALRLELGPLGVDVLSISTDLAVSPPPTPSPLEALERALERLGPGRPRQALGNPLRALLARAATHANLADAAVEALLAPKPRARVQVRSSGRLLAARASRALQKAASKKAT